MLQYQEIFNQRANTYHQAMQLLPQSRDDEFKSLFHHYNLQPGHHLIDFPSGGGYLANYLPHSVQYTAFEVSTLFAELGSAQLSSWNIIPLQNETADAVVCCASLHHVSEADRYDFFTEAKRVLKTGGHLLLADVEQNSPQAIFLNGFVDAHNSMGHEGDFFEPAFAKTVQGHGFEIANNEVKSFYWKLGTHKGKAVQYVRWMFGLDKATDAEIEAAMIHQLSFFYHQALQQWVLPWQLRYITAVSN